MQRKGDLEDSLQAQQYFADANEAETWMKEKEPIMGNTDYGRDEDSAEVGWTISVQSGYVMSLRTFIIWNAVWICTKPLVVFLM